MQKLGVEVDKEATKTANEKTSPTCPECHSPLIQNVNVPTCPKCGTEAFEVRG